MEEQVVNGGRITRSLINCQRCTMSNRSTDPDVDDLEPSTSYEPIKRLTRDLKKASVTLTSDEARFLVDNYYMMQEQRKRTSNQVRVLAEGKEPHEVLSWFMTQASGLEGQVMRALDAYSGSRPEGIWARSQKGIGPVISSGLLAHINIERAPTVGHIWRFAGLDPTCKWGKGEKRPWNGALKRLCWIIGECFTKVSGYDDAVYGKIYAERKLVEIARNEQGLFAGQAAESLANVRWKGESGTKTHYEAGRLPPARLHLRAQRYAVKLFLAHYHEVAYVVKYGKLPPKPYILTKPEHAHHICPPNAPDEVIRLRREAGWTV